MKEFIKRLKTDKEFAKKFDEYLIDANGKVKQGSDAIKRQLDELVMTTIKDFAEKNNMKLTDDVDVSKSYAAICKQIALQLDDMIIKQFKALQKMQIDLLK